MLFWLAPYLCKVWGPFRLLGSHLVLLSVGTMLAGLLIYLYLPKLWQRLPTDKGKMHTPDGGVRALGKPTGAGIILAQIVLPIVLLFVPLDWPMLGVVGCLYFCMLFGYLDDASSVPWGQLKKGLLDAVVAFSAAAFIYWTQGSHVWLPVLKNEILVSAWIYIPCAAMLLWFSMNATNCSDGVDGLAGTLTLISLFALVGMLYGVVGYKPVANYLLIPHNADAARWAILMAINAGAVAGYLWWNAEPSRVLMGDAGSRLLGMLVGVAVLIAGNPFLIIVVSPVVLVNGGTGLFKLVLLRSLRKIGFDTRPPSTLPAEDAAQLHVLVKALHSVRFPLHDHCRHRLGWSNAQVLMRFALLQGFLIPLLFVILVKIR